MSHSLIKSDPPPKTYLSIWSTPCSPFMVIPPPPLAHCCTNTLLLLVYHSLFSHICAHHSLSYILLTVLTLFLSLPVILIVTTTTQLHIVTHYPCSLLPITIVHCHHCCDLFQSMLIVMCCPLLISVSWVHIGSSCSLPHTDNSGTTLRLELS